jgi:hypothetical protein
VNIFEPTVRENNSMFRELFLFKNKLLPISPLLFIYIKS